ncbi:tRNA (adenosine(37)-N6)-threonylcarbamoyltransferase complex dimerization subunit type 1 TsaB [Aurantivibrio infirmus]
MSQLLAIDTSTAACSVAISTDGKVVEDFVIAPQDHTQRLLPMVDNLLASKNLQLSDIDAIAFTNGPGSFTGLRICLSIVQGLAFGANLPVIPISTLEVMVAGAQRLLNLGVQQNILPMLDARMAEVYWGLYKPADQSDQAPICLVADSVSSFSEVMKSKAGEYLRSQPCLGLGDGWNTLNSDISGQGNEDTASADLVVHGDFYPHAYDLAVLGQLLFDQGKAIPVDQAKLNYLRNEISWQKRQKIRKDQ